jgi:hypothetical protein
MVDRQGGLDFSMMVPIKGGGGIYNVDNRIFRFPNDDIKAEMMLSSWNNFLQPLLDFVVVRSNHDERLVRLSTPELMSVSLGSDRLGSVSLLHSLREKLALVTGVDHLW